MAEWTREHDAHIARECEGWKLVTEGVMAGGWQTPGGRHEYAPARYTENANARDRAAEAWRKQKEGRSYQVQSGLSDDFGVKEAWATCFASACRIAGDGNGEHALLWALWKATGGKE